MAGGIPLRSSIQSLTLGKAGTKGRSKRRRFGSASIVTWANHIQISSHKICLASSCISPYFMCHLDPICLSLYGIASNVLKNIFIYCIRGSCDWIKFYLLKWKSQYARWVGDGVKVGFIQNAPKKLRKYINLSMFLLAGHRTTGVHVDKNVFFLSGLQAGTNPSQSAFVQMPGEFLDIYKS